MQSQEVILDLQSLGARIDVPVQDRGRRGGAGPSDDKAFMLAGVAAMVPTLGSFAQSSPYAVVAGENGAYNLTRDGIPLMPVEFAPTPQFYSLSTKDGIPYRKIAVLHGDPADPQVTWLEGPGSGRRDIAWLPGSSARFAPDLEVLDPSGRVIAHEGSIATGGCIARFPTWFVDFQTLALEVTEPPMAVEP